MRTMRIGPVTLLCAAAVAAVVPVAAHATPVEVPCRAGVLHAIGTGRAAFAAVATGKIQTYRRPRGEVLATFPKVTELRYPTTFSIVGVIVNADCDPSWYRIKLPMRPNGIVGYVRPDDVVVEEVSTHISVDLSRRTLSLYREGRLVLTTPVSVGAAATPTPIGRYYVNQRIFLSDANGPFGPAALGVSAFSNVLTGWARGGPIAIHGTDAPWSIGRAASHGCIRVPNATLLQLFAATPAGTPVVIHP